MSGLVFTCQLCGEYTTQIGKKCRCERVDVEPTPSVEREVIGVACLNGHDLTHYVKCGHCLDQLTKEHDDYRALLDAIKSIQRDRSLGTVERYEKLTDFVEELIKRDGE